MKIIKKVKRKLKKYSQNHKWFRPIFVKTNYAVRRLKYRISSIIHMTDKHTVVFESFWGASYNCSPKAIYEAMLQDPRFADFQYIWVVKKYDDHLELLEHPNTTLVKKNSRRYYRAFTTAKYWVHNMSLPDFMYPKKNQVYIETWHGIPLKRVGCDIQVDSDYRRGKSETQKAYELKGKKMDYMLSTSPFYTEAIGSAFGLAKSGNEKAMVPTGYPRNDRLYHFTPEEAAEIRAKLGVAEGKKTILYCPTWRDTKVAEGVGYTLDTGLDLRRLHEILGDGYVFLYRSHHHVKRYDLIPEELEGWVLDVTTVEDINDLYLISDMMVTDYSSSCFDYANLRRPEVFFMYDLEEYGSSIRGFYFDVSELPGPIVKTTEELGQAILDTFEHFTVDEKYQKFIDKFITYDDGCAAKRVLDTCFAPEEPEPFYMKEFLHRHPALYWVVHVLAVIFRGGWWVLLKIKRFFNIAERKLGYQYLRLKYTVRAAMVSRGWKKDENFERLLSYKNKHAGERCFLIGNGPSLKAADLDLLKDEICFGCNMIHKIFPQTDWRPSYMCATDRSLIHHLYSRFEKDFPYPLFVNQVTYKSMQYYPEHCTYVQNLTSDPYKYHPNMLAYYSPSNATVMSFMLELAMFMGFKEICLIGVDCTSSFGAGGHFIQGYVNNADVRRELEKVRRHTGNKEMTIEEVAEHHYRNATFAYKVLEEASQKIGIKIYNCTRGGALEEFERKKLEDVLGIEG